MKKLVLMLIAGLLIYASPYGRTDPTPNPTANDQQTAAKKAEERGDLARVRENYSQAASYYYAALRDSAIRKLKVEGVLAPRSASARSSVRRAHAPA